jgi:hypothetical protein
MGEYYPFNYSFHCECKILDINEQERNISYNLNTKIGLGDLNFLTKKLFLKKYKKIVSSIIEEDDNIKSYKILRYEFVMDLR